MKPADKQICFINDRLQELKISLVEERGGGGGGPSPVLGMGPPRADASLWPAGSPSDVPVDPALLSTTGVPNST